MMDEDYFEMVAEKYDKLAETAPIPEGSVSIRERADGERAVHRGERAKRVKRGSFRCGFFEEWIVGDEPEVRKVPGEKTVPVRALKYDPAPSPTE